MRPREDDLLQPTLSPDLDVRIYGRLFKPQSILWPTFFGGPVAGGILFGMNYARMGRRDLALRCWIGGVVVGLALAIGVGWYLTDPAATSEVTNAAARNPSTRLTRYIIAGISVAIGWLVAKHQEPRFTAWEGHGNEPANLWVPGLLAVFVGAIFIIGVALGTVALRGGFD